MARWSPGLYSWSDSSTHNMVERLLRKNNKNIKLNISMVEPVTNITTEDNPKLYTFHVQVRLQNVYKDKLNIGYQIVF